ncbi:hypothetical protein [Paraflavitalea sp. CAU 1676]|uniref:hypothetical protein n=1 Tax=Paraflavitalea sp. CAU 1676 TaxID=3032598 RepID=UPI0023DB9253|nr:hypothetical protein [Paraflavitalea sp. CAU 1676]MDF2187735.1 hypothetical protein [Paraflavitalea sp. CAU 1676]
MQTYRCLILLLIPLLQWLATTLPAARLFFYYVRPSRKTSRVNLQPSMDEE